MTSLIGLGVQVSFVPIFRFSRFHCLIPVLRSLFDVPYFITSKFMCHVQSKIVIISDNGKQVLIVEKLYELAIHQ